MSFQPHAGLPSRRAVARGAAWTVPVVALAASAPAMAVSNDPCAEPQGCPKPYTNLTIGKISGGGCGPTQYRVRFSGTIGFTDSKVGSQLSDAKLYFFLPDADLTFTSATTGSGWTLLTRDPSTAPISDGGVDYYPYVTSYSPAITPADGTFELPRSDTFSTNCTKLSHDDCFTRRSTQVNGATITATGPKSALPIL